MIPILTKLKIGLEIKTLFFFYRDQFLNANVTKTTIDMDQRRTIVTVKFIARCYSNLTEIMDQINFCYSLQVFAIQFMWFIYMEFK